MLSYTVQPPVASIASAQHRSPCPPGPKCRAVKVPAPRRVAVMKSGGGVIDKPAIAKPGTDRRTGTVKKRPPVYKVILHNDNHNRREYVVQVLLKIVDGLTVDDAVNVMNEAHMNGMALVTCCAQEVAENYTQRLRSNGLTATMEPDRGAA